MKAKYILLLFLIFLISVFLIQNAEIINVKIFVWELSISLSLLVIISILTGFFLYWLVRMRTKIQKMMSNKNKNVKQ